MLVLSRKKNEAIIVGDQVRVIVTSIRGDKVRIGIEAPASLPIHREEVAIKIAKEDSRKKSA